MKTAVGEAVRFVAVEWVGSLLRFPIWWYGDGFAEVARWIVRSLGYRLKSYSFGVWLQNFFVPMYGQYDITGRLVSVFMRFVVLVGRLIAFAFEAMAYAALALVWLAIPAAAVLGLLGNVFAVAG